MPRKGAPKSEGSGSGKPRTRTGARSAPRSTGSSVPTSSATEPSSAGNSVGAKPPTASPKSGRSVRGGKGGSSSDPILTPELAQRIRDAVASMDKSRPRQWTATGEPKVSRVAKLVGVSLTRPQIAAALTNNANNAARAKPSTNSTGPSRAGARAHGNRTAEPVSKPDELPPEPEKPSDLDPRSFLARARQPHRRDLTVEQVVAALTATGGARAAAAQRLGVTRSAVTKFLQRHPEVAEAADEIRNTFVDLAEAQLIKAAQNGEGWAIRYLLDNQGADLGYGRKVVVKGDPENPIHHKPDTYDFGHLNREEKRAMLDLMRKARGNGGNAPSV